MRRILLIGAGGSGKSVLAARIAAQSGLPLIHLDALFWKPGWVETPRDEWKRIVEELIQRDAWVMDGNYGGTLDLRLAACDTVLFLDFPPIVCLWLLRAAAFLAPPDGRAEWNARWTSRLWNLWVLIDRGELSHVPGR